MARRQGYVVVRIHRDGEQQHGYNLGRWVTDCAEERNRSKHRGYSVKQVTRTCCCAVMKERPETPIGDAKKNESTDTRAEQNKQIGVVHGNGSRIIRAIGHRIWGIWSESCAE